MKKTARGKPQVRTGDTDPVTSTEKPKESPTQDSASQTIAARLSESQKELIEKAAKVKGWTASNFVRVAAVERAAHVINTSDLTQIDMRGTAERLASFLLRPEAHLIYTDTGERVSDWDRTHGEVANDVDVEVKEFPSLPQLKDACRFGGVEFMNYVLDRIDEALARSRTDIPPPIDPGEAQR